MIDKDDNLEALLCGITYITSPKGGDLDRMVGVATKGELEQVLVVDSSVLHLWANKTTQNHMLDQCQSPGFL